nr:hypothetical protein [Candidatus Sigynarchaeota archaeon]
LVVVSDNPKTIDKRLLNSIDFMVDMDVPTREEREFYLKHLFEPEASVNFAMITDEMDEWTWGDIESFAKHAMIQKQSMEMKELSTKFLLDALHGENGLDRFDPPSVKLQKGLSRSKIDDDEPRGTTSTAAKKEPPIMANASIPASSPGRPDDPFKELLWQSAAEQDYDALIRTLDHLEKGVYVQEDRSLLFRYPFLLEDEVLVAKRKLEAAKNKIDMIKKHFKGVNRS